VIGFDNNPFAQKFSPVPLTTIQQPLHKMAVVAAEILCRKISKKLEGHKRVLLETELIERNSCRARLLKN
jgi:DNA-binding LacI/PurR family transcriptional regulator